MMNHQVIRRISPGRVRARVGSASRWSGHMTSPLQPLLGSLPKPSPYAAQPTRISTTEDRGPVLPIYLRTAGHLAQFRPSRDEDIKIQIRARAEETTVDLNYVDKITKELG